MKWSHSVIECCSIFQLGKLNKWFDGYLATVSVPLYQFYSPLTLGMAASICCFTSHTFSSFENCRHFSALMSGILTCMSTRSGSVSASPGWGWSPGLITTPSSMTVLALVMLTESYRSSSSSISLCLPEEGLILGARLTLCSDQLQRDLKQK